VAKTIRRTLPTLCGSLVEMLERLSPRRRGRRLISENEGRSRNTSLGGCRGMEAGRRQRCARARRASEQDRRARDIVGGGLAPRDDRHTQPRSEATADAAAIRSTRGGHIVARRPGMSGRAEVARAEQRGRRPRRSEGPQRLRSLPMAIASPSRIHRVVETRGSPAADERRADALIARQIARKRGSERTDVPLSCPHAGGARHCERASHATRDTRSVETVLQGSTPRPDELPSPPASRVCRRGRPRGTSSARSFA
jgi:hypothetical protein